MSDDWDRQRDIEAEGQRAAIFHAKKNDANLPSRGGQRLLGISAEGRPVDNVTMDNRCHVDPKTPLREIQLLSEDHSKVLRQAFIPRWRAFPDVVMVDGKPFTLIKTQGIPQYAECLFVETV